MRRRKQNNNLTNPCPPCCTDPGTWTCNHGTGTIVYNGCCIDSDTDFGWCTEGPGNQNAILSYNCVPSGNCPPGCTDSENNWSHVPGYISPPVIPPDISRTIPSQHKRLGGMTRPNIGDPTTPCNCVGGSCTGGSCCQEGASCGWYQSWSSSGNAYDWVYEDCCSHASPPPPPGANWKNLGIDRVIPGATKRRGGRAMRSGGSVNCPNGYTNIDEFGNNIC